MQRRGRLCGRPLSSRPATIVFAVGSWTTLDGQALSESAPAGMQVGRGDYVTEVKGLTSMQAISQALMSQKCVKVKVTRPSLLSS